MFDLVRLTVTNPSEADLICAFLRSEGIPSTVGTTPLVASEQVGGIGGWQEILVRDADLPRAKELLASLRED